MGRTNLDVAVKTCTRRIRFDGKRAVGVDVDRAGKTLRIEAEREVLPCAGAINSPQLLMLSGVGSADELSRHGIQAKQTLDGVGRNLQDHLEVYVQYACRLLITLYGAQKWRNRARIGGQWLLTRTGLGATNHFEFGGFIRSAAGVRYPDLQYHFPPMAISYDGSSSAACHGFHARPRGVCPKQQVAGPGDTGVPGQGAFKPPCQPRGQNTRRATCRHEWGAASQTRL